VSIWTASANSRSSSSTTARTASSCAARPAKRRRSPTTKFSLWETAVDLLHGRATVVAGTGTYDTRHSIHLTERAHTLGVDACLIVTPYYSKPPQRGIVEHFKAIAAATDKPIVVYNIPSRVVINIEPATMSQLAEIENVQAVNKRTTTSTRRRRFRVRPRPLRGRRQPHLPFLSSAASAASASTHTLWGRR
jgi:dihydrodipicolinate synthase/N-acetylneuraminate lyase